MFKVNNKDTRATSLTYFTPFSSVSIVDVEQVNHTGDVKRYTFANCSDILLLTLNK